MLYDIRIKIVVVFLVNKVHNAKFFSGAFKLITETIFRNLFASFILRNINDNPLHKTIFSGSKKELKRQILKPTQR